MRMTDLDRRPLLGLLFLVLAGILFPFGWLGEQWSAFGDALGAVFPTGRSHAIGHAGLFLGLGLLALVSFPRLRARSGLYAALALAVALGQEVAQLLYKQRPLQLDDGRDIAVDLLGAAAAFVLVTVWGWLVMKVTSPG